MAMLYLSNRVCSSLAAHILLCIFKSKFSQRVNTVVSWGRRINLYFLVSTQMTLNLTQRLVFRSGKIEYLKGLRSWKKKLSKHWRDNSVNKQIEMWWNRIFMKRQLMDVQIANEVPSNETNFETNVPKLWERIEKAWNLLTLVKINWAFLNRKYKSHQDIYGTCTTRIA